MRMTLITSRIFLGNFLPWRTRFSATNSSKLSFLKIIPAFETDVLRDNFGWSRQTARSPPHHPCQPHGLSKCRLSVFGCLMRTAQIVGDRRFFNMAFQSHPAWKSILAGDRQLRILRLSSASKMAASAAAQAGPNSTSAAEPLPASRHAPSFEQSFRLILQMFQIGDATNGSASFRRHGELTLPVQVHIYGQKVSS